MGIIYPYYPWHTEKNIPYDRFAPWAPYSPYDKFKPYTPEQPDSRDYIGETIERHRKMIYESKTNWINHTIKELKNGYEILIACPGFDSSYIETSLHSDRALTVKSSRNSIFDKSLNFELTLDRDSDIISVEFKEGVLSIITEHKQDNTPPIYKVGYRKKEKDVIVSES